jgi:hypothetical protein
MPLMISFKRMLEHGRHRSTEDGAADGIKGSGGRSRVKSHQRPSCRAPRISGLRLCAGRVKRVGIYLLGGRAAFERMIVRDVPIRFVGLVGKQR